MLARARQPGSRSIFTSNKLGVGWIRSWFLKNGKNPPFIIHFNMGWKFGFQALCNCRCFQEYVFTCGRAFARAGGFQQVAVGKCWFLQVDGYGWIHHPFFLRFVVAELHSPEGNFYDHHPLKLNENIWRNAFPCSNTPNWAHEKRAAGGEW